MRVALLTREYPPGVYGGAGVHVEYLARELARLIDLTVHCEGDLKADDPANAPVEDTSPTVRRHRPWAALDGTNDALRTFSMDLAMAAAATVDLGGVDLVHSHTWYTNLGGHLAALLAGVPHVMTSHSLEPRRPWKAEQLGGGYRLSSWAEKTAIEAAAAVVAVSAGMKADILDAYPEVDPAKVHVIRNGIDTDEYSPDLGTDVLERHGVDPDRPSVVFVGRITRQKGVPVLLRAAAELDPRAQLVLCAGAPDTPELLAEVTELVDGLRARRDGVIWISGMLEKTEVIQLLSHASLFACPSVYEPLGIVNLEAMACGAAVVASRVGGIPEVVDEGVTGLLVPPDDPAALAGAMNDLLASPARARTMGERGRARAVDQFGWPAVARQTAELYESLLAR
ncbi:glycogen synthase [Frankia sp. CNm7]|uniref:Glycogen synthase n=1 Tax=Frankia nepalensis TaxID=1836974 RepID=A0A937RJR8_9ACTN|nr:glycogen synthase [Frankia nepalensis]MBL7494836.1 glycogen synthase [Frankia nepalensis]MBL7514076.1 glycogen synthase [Frankia nepalensis]MBL7518743.1 glycogen synthase [Frankia nepalensis]MBL7633546.1 glycogen synthase [Frankia nepalensis]